MFSIGAQHRASAASTTKHLEPLFLVRAGNTGDVYAYFQSTTVPGRNVIELSKDGDRSFRPMGSLPLNTGTAPDITAVQQLVFANAMDGMAIGSSVKTSQGFTTPIYATRDGGRTWTTTEISPTTQIRDLASTPGYWYAVTSRCLPANVECSHYRLQRTPVSNTHWTSLPLPSPLAKYGSVMNLTAYGDDVWLSTMDQISAPYPSYVAISHNYGESFSVSIHPQLNAVTACGVEAMSYQVLWAICNQGMMTGQIPYSDDGGLHWLVAPQGDVLSSFQFGSFDPLDAQLAFAVEGNAPVRLYRIVNGTSPPEIVGMLPNHIFPNNLCFVNERVGFLLTDGEGSTPSMSILYTSDGGAHWSKSS
jgi:hypothetical protein